MLFRIKTILLEEIYESILSFLLHKAYGSGKILNQILHRFKNKIMPLSTHNFNVFFQLHYCLIEFRDSSTITLKKPGKNNPNKPEDYLEPKSYCLIALLDTTKKILKTIVAKQNAYLAETYNLLQNTYIERKRCILTKFAI